MGASLCDVLIFKYFRQKNRRKYLRFPAKLLLVLQKNMIITLALEKNTNFFAENCRKLQKILIITSTPEAGSLKMTLSGTFKAGPKLARLRKMLKNINLTP
jgi:hypothetical protein